MNCGSCKYLTDIDKSQDGGICHLSGEFHKFHNMCDQEPERAYWKGAGMGDYYCSLCCKTVSGGNRLRYCPNCGAEMYTDKEWEIALEEFKLEDEIYGII